MHPKSLFFSVIAVLIAAQAGCSDPQSSDLSNTQSAISMRNFDTEGGEPWNRSQNILLPSTENGTTNFGRIIQTGDINADGKLDIISSFKTSSNTDRIDIYYGSSSGIFSLNTATEKTPDGFGYAAKAGQFCPSLGAKGDILIASAPDYSNKAGAFGLIYRTTAVKVQRRLNHGKAGEHAGQYFDIADYDGNKSPDLVYSTLINGKAGVVFAKDLCSQNGTIAVAHTYDLPSSYTADDAGTIIKTASFKDIAGADTLVVASPATKEILFLALKNDKIVQIRPALQVNADIQSIEIADMTNDGLPDLILGLKSAEIPGGYVTILPNPGANKAFSMSDAIWSEQAKSKSADFGYSIKAVDLNEDGYMDLIVGAPGEYEGHGKIYVMMGTADGSVLSKPYWQSTAKNSVMGLGATIHAAKINASSKGWLDILAGTPAGSGNVTAYYQDNRPCYTADKCLVNDLCFDKGDIKDKCEVCDPAQNNFNFVPLQCPESPNPCQTAATCIPQKGCVYNTAPDNTPCRAPSCQNNNLSFGTCDTGKCYIQTVDCGSYVCKDDEISCPTSCKSNTDCVEGLVCNVNVKHCVPSTVNHAPVAVLPDQLTLQKYDDVIEITGTQSYDIDNDPLTYAWNITGPCQISNKDGETVSVSPIQGEASSGSVCMLSLTVYDPQGAHHTTTTPIKIISSSLSDFGVQIVLPFDNSTVETHVTFVVETKTHHDYLHIINAHTGQIICSAGKDVKTCSADLDDGKYTVYADAGSFPSKDIHITVTKPIPYSISITSPKDNEILSTTTPVISGIVDGPCKTVLVYSRNLTQYDNEFVYCKADVKDDKWACQASHPLNAYSEYYFFAYCIANSTGIRSDSVHVSTPATCNHDPVCTDDQKAILSCQNGVEITTICPYLCQNSVCIDEPKPTCDHKPICSKDGRAILSCRNGVEIATTCPYQCQDGVCIDEPKPTCDHKPICSKDERAILSCRNGVEIATTCPYQCKNGVCIDKPKPTCDHKPICSDDFKAVLSCENGVEIVTECPLLCTKGKCNDEPKIICRHKPFCTGDNEVLVTCEEGEEIVTECLYGCAQGRCLDMPQPPDDFPEYLAGEVRGGSCSISTKPSNSIAWLLFMLPAAALIRRKRRI